MPLLRCLCTPASLADLRRHFDFLDLLKPYAERLMRGPSPLSPGERELIAAYVSGLNSCHYCHGSHTLVAQGFGVQEGLLEQMLSDIDTAAVPDKLRPLLLYVRKLTMLPSRLTQADADAVYDTGWDDEALMHAIAVCAYFNNMNRLVEGSGIVGSPEIHALAAEKLVLAGYLSIPQKNREKV